MTNQLQDETDLVQYGQEDENIFYSFSMPAPLPSSWIYYPTEESPSTRYKFVSIEINFNLDQNVWTRLGDLGGLYDALYFMCLFLISPLSSFALHTSLMTSFFRLKGDSLESTGKNPHSLDDLCSAETLGRRRRMS